jgi:pimeloyl-ACP methyl ester carboxylesterase
MVGCAGPRQEIVAPGASMTPRGVVLVADGAGGFEATSAALRQAIHDQGLPLAVERFEWSHGYGRFFADEVDSGHAREVGQRLAAKVIEERAAFPDRAIYLVGHSAGTGVVLAAAEALPPASVDRLVLLAPSVSAEYDLRPALRCAREGIDVFTSGRDWAYLGLGIALIGTADGCWQAAAGRVGFRPVLEGPGDTALYTKLRQHAWDPSVAWTGNRGGHYGCHEDSFLRAYVLPLLQPPAPPRESSAPRIQRLTYENLCSFTKR